jgi:predicted TIM-barrel fold metal-dependent hydrolase
VLFSGAGARLSRYVSAGGLVGLAWMASAVAQVQPAPGPPPSPVVQTGTAGEVGGAASGASAVAGSGASAGAEPLALTEFLPEPRLRVGATLLESARFPVVDVHVHPRIRLRHDADALDGYVALMDRNRIAVSVSLDGGLGTRLDEHIAYLWTKYRQRFVIFANIDWQGSGAALDPASWDCHREDFARRMVRELEIARDKGVSGLKIFKSFGLEVRNPDGTLVAIDDPRFFPIWEACGRLQLPVIMHTADPSAFFEPLTPRNERYEELSRHPDWHFPPERFPSRASLHAARNRVIEQHPGTKFIAAHLGNDGEDLQEVAQWLERYPNLVVEFASRISELGRQPYSARDFLVAYQDRVLFGTDGPWPELRYQRYWRFLETRDEYFPYSEKEFPPQGLWRIYGVELPDAVLQKIYHGNAARWIPGVRERLGVVSREATWGD